METRYLRTRIRFLVPCSSTTLLKKHKTLLTSNYLLNKVNNGTDHVFGLFLLILMVFLVSVSGLTFMRIMQYENLSHGKKRLYFNRVVPKQSCPLGSFEIFRYRNFVGYREEPDNFVQLRYNDRDDGHVNRDGFWPQLIFNGGIYLFVDDGEAGYFWYVSLFIFLVFVSM